MTSEIQNPNAGQPYGPTPTSTSSGKISSAQKAAALFHIRNTAPRVMSPATLSANLRVVVENASKLPDSAWEDIRYAPNVLGVDQTSVETKLTEDQLKAFKLIVDFVKSRKEPLLYAVQALDNMYQDEIKLPTYVHDMMKIVAQCLKNQGAAEIQSVIKQNRADVLNGLRRAFAVYQQAGKSEEFFTLLKESGLISEALIKRITQ